MPLRNIPVQVLNVQDTGVLASATSHGGSGDFVAIPTVGLGSVDFAVDNGSTAPSGAALIFESTSDGTTWLPTTAYQKGVTPKPAGSNTATAAGVYNVAVAGAQEVRVRLTAITSGSFNVTANGTAAAAHISAHNANAADFNATVIPAATNKTDRSGSINGTVTGAGVASGGSGGTNGAATVTGTTGTGTPFQANVTIAGGAITAVNSITVGGLYTASPTNVAAEPVTGAGLTGATLSLTMAGGQTLMAPANPLRRKYVFQPNSITSSDWALNDTGNGVTAALGAKGSLQISAMVGASGGRGDIYSDESTAPIWVYNSTAFATFYGTEY